MGSCNPVKEFSDFISGSKLLDHPGHYQLLYAYAPWSFLRAVDIIRFYFLPFFLHFSFPLCPPFPLFLPSFLSFFMNSLTLSFS